MFFHKFLFYFLCKTAFKLDSHLKKTAKHFILIEKRLKMLGFFLLFISFPFFFAKVIPVVNRKRYKALQTFFMARQQNQKYGPTFYDIFFVFENFLRIIKNGFCFVLLLSYLFLYLKIILIEPCSCNISKKFLLLLKCQILFRLFKSLFGFVQKQFSK